ncbi:MAG: hypothetical protein LBQ74_13855 [Prevotella sp.]|jgi:hypothetical protein|nr:hypothetical protein [Prevotella sp.]
MKVKKAKPTPVELLNMILLMQQLMQDDETELYYIDLFCGAGGTSTGVELARIDGRLYHG